MATTTTTTSSWPWSKHPSSSLVVVGVGAAAAAAAAIVIPPSFDASQQYSYSSKLLDADEWEASLRCATTVPAFAVAWKLVVVGRET